MVLQLIPTENSSAKKEQRLAVIVPDGPMDCNEVLKLWPAEPIRTSRANTCGIQAYLLRYELKYYTSFH